VQSTHFERLGIIGEGNIMATVLVNRILDQDPSSILLARQVGSLAGESVKPLITHNDSVVRQIAIYSAYEAGVTDLSVILVHSLTDDAPSVRSAALVVLKKRPDGNIYQDLLQVYPDVRDQDDRQQIALLIGETPGAQIGDLIKLRDTEADPTARKGLVVALAKLGHIPSQDEFLDSLDGKGLRRNLEHAEYIGQHWLLPSLLRILSNKAPLIFIGNPHASLPGPGNLRACDIAVDLIAQITKARFSFPIDNPTNYTDSQLQEVKELTLWFMDKNLS
jgi:hypothetical protein